MTTSPIVTQINAQRQNMLRIRAYFPFVSSDMVGQREIRLPSFHSRHAHSITMTFSEPLDYRDIGEMSGTGQWLMQNYIVRLFALLEHHGVVPAQGKGEVRTDLTGHEHVEVLRDLHLVFVNSDGRYDKDSAEDRMLYERVVSQYSLPVESSHSASEFPLDIDKVLLRMTDGCIAYVHELAKETA